MTRNEAAILARLSPMMPLQPSWMEPKAFGATANSHHSVTARRMVEKGWLERRERRAGRYRRSDRPAWEYRITVLGRTALANHVALQGAFQARRVTVNG